MKNYPEYPTDNDILLRDMARASGVTDFNVAKGIKDTAQALCNYREHQLERLHLLKRICRMYGTHVVVEKRKASKGKQI
jgi:hypothetical protein